MLKVVNFAQIVISVLLIAMILMQNKSAGISAVFGGGEGNIFHAKRGAEKWMFYATIALTALFIALGVVSLVLQRGS